MLAHDHGRCPFGRSIVGAALLSLLACAACSDSEDAPRSPGELGVRLQFLESAGCDPLPAGTLPAAAAELKLSLFPNVTGSSPLQEVTVPVDPRARCRDGQGREFSCPFDVDGDGLRERFFAFDPQPLTTALVLWVSVRDADGVERWNGRSEPTRPAAEGGTVISVTLKPRGGECG